MMQLAAVVVGVAIGLVIGWLLAVARSRRTLENALREAETSATAAISETIAVRKELESRKLETEGLRAELRDVENARAALDARADEMRQRFDEQQRMLGEAERKLSDTFRSLAADVLKNTNESFLTLAGERLNSLVYTCSTRNPSRRLIVSTEAKEPRTRRTASALFAAMELATARAAGSSSLSGRQASTAPRR